MSVKIYHGYKKFGWSLYNPKRYIIISFVKDNPKKILIQIAATIRITFNALQYMIPRCFTETTILKKKIKTLFYVPNMGTDIKTKNSVYLFFQKIDQIFCEVLFNEIKTAHNHEEIILFCKKKECTLPAENNYVQKNVFLISTSSGCCSIL